MSNKSQQKGYTLPEALIAAVIAAGVIATASTSISSSLKGIRKSSEASVTLLEAENLAAQLKGGMPIENASDAYPDWLLDQSYFDETKQRHSTGTALLQIHATHRTISTLTFSVFRIAETKGP